MTLSSMSTVIATLIKNKIIVLTLYYFCQYNWLVQFKLQPENGCQPKAAHKPELSISCHVSECVVPIDHGTFSFVTFFSIIQASQSWCQFCDCKS